MFVNYLKSTFRYLIKQKWYTLVNIFGLSIGYIAFIIIFLFIQKETGFDNFHENAENIYRLEEKWIRSGEEQHSAATTDYLAPYLIENYPEVESGTKLLKAIWTAIINYEEKKFPEERFCFVDSTFFNFFNFRLIEGNRTTALNSPDKVVLTETTAKKYFGNENPIGKQIHYDGNHVFTVSGIIEDMPENSHFHFDLIFPLQFMMRFFSDRDKGDNVFYSYVRLRESNEIQQLKSKVNNEIATAFGYRDKLNREGISCEIIFQPLLDIHLKGNAEREIESNGNELFIMILRIVAFFLLLVAGINYSNLATAKSMKRAKEIGIRKVLGSKKMDIFFQYMGESYFLTAVSLIVSLLLLLFMIPVFNSIFNVNLSLNLLNNYPLLISLFAAIIFFGFLSGFYPALILANMNILKSLKLKSSQSVGKKSKLSFRATLTIIQFTVSVFFIIGSLVVTGHLKFLQNKDVGFDKEDIMVVPLKGSEVRNRETLKTIKEELIKTGKIKNATVSFVVPGERFPFHTVRFPRLVGNGTLQSKEPDGSIWMRVMLGDEDMIQTLGLTIKEGRNFSKAQEGNENGFIINETAAKYLGLEQPIGEPVEYTLNVVEPHRGQIIGVVEDFNFASLLSQVEPVVLCINDRFRYYLILKTEPVKERLIILDVKNLWDKFYPDIPFDYYFLNDKYKSLYKTEDTMQNLASIFTFIAIFIAAMGLFGISFYMMEQRKKEIGIRKVMGASIVSVLYLISKEFIILVIIANLLAWVPITVLLNKWLQNFAYHDGINYMVYLFTIIISVLIALITVNFNVLKTALANPVEVIKEE